MILYAGIVSDVGQFLNQNGENPWAGIQDINQLIPGLINIAIVIAALVFFFMLLIGGIKWITAGGDKEAAGSAQKIITSAITGIAVVFSAWAIKRVVYYFFKLEETSGSPPIVGCTPPTGKIGNDGGGGCCGYFTSQEGKRCDSGDNGGCRSWEVCIIGNGTCASTKSCCAQGGHGCSQNSDCCSNICMSNKQCR